MADRHLISMACVCRAGLVSLGVGGWLYNLWPVWWDDSINVEMKVYT